MTRCRAFAPAPFHGGQRRRPFFEGWYFKQSSDAGAFSVIPGVFLDGSGDTAFVQLIFGAPSQSFFIPYPIGAFYSDPERFDIRIGANRFSMDGVTLDIAEIGLTASLCYSRHVPLSQSLFCPSIMGPFGYFPNMQCNHGVLSLFHRVNGAVHFRGRRMEFHEADGYIEKDWGREFPQSWVWIQCGRSDAALMCAVASIPFAGLKFTGLICAMQCGEEQYRFATYNGAKPLYVRTDGLRVETEIARGWYRLRIVARGDAPGTLKAPAPSGMVRDIPESITAHCEVSLTRKGRVLFAGQFENGGLEMLNPQALIRHG